MRRSLATCILVLLAVLLTAATTPQAADPELTTRQSFRKAHQLGIRLGPWINLGETPVPRYEDENESFKTNFHDASFYFEGYYAHRFTPALRGEFSLGILNRGSVTFTVDDRTNVGNVLLYAALLQGKVYPFISGDWMPQPYLTAGGGLYYGRRSVQFTSTPDGYYYPNIDEQSAARLNFTIGGGLDWPLATQIGLDLNVKYCPIPFGEPLMTINDYDGLAIAVGIKYFYIRSQDESESNANRSKQ